VFCLSLLILTPDREGTTASVQASRWRLSSQHTGTNFPPDKSCKAIAGEPFRATCKNAICPAKK